MRTRVARQSAICARLSTDQRSDDSTWLNAPTTVVGVPKLGSPSK